MLARAKALSLTIATLLVLTLVPGAPTSYASLGYARDRQDRPTTAAPPGDAVNGLSNGLNGHIPASNPSNPFNPLPKSVDSTTTRVSVASDGSQGNAWSILEPSISADGRYVAFCSWASNLVSGDTNDVEDVFVHDRQTGQTTRVSVASDGGQGNNWSGYPSISADGRYVAFRSGASNLAGGDTNGDCDVFVHDRQTGQTTRVSVASDGSQGNGGSWYLSISADGRYVAFESYASNLVSGDTNNAIDVFVHDRQTGQTTRVSVASDGTQGNSVSYGPSISADGRYVAFYSLASNLVSGDTNDTIDVFVHDRGGGGDATWTLMLYLDSDNNLDVTYPPIFNRLEAAANNPNVQVVAVWDRSGTNNSAYYEVQYDTDLTRLATYTADVNYWPKGELNMGDAATVVDFVNWARTNYPAQHYALILSDHGGGLGGAMWDDTDSGAHLTVSEIGTALASVTLTGTNKIDVLYMDACLMAMIEDAYQVRDYVDYYVASENLQWSYTTAYSRYISETTGTTTPAQLATLFSTGYHDEKKSGSRDYTISATDISRLDDVVAAVNSLAALLNSQMETHSGTLTTIGRDVQRFDSNGDLEIDLNDEYVDLRHFAELVRANISDSSIQSAAQAVIDTIDAYVIDEHHQTRTGTAVPNSHGVSIFFPREGFRRSFYTGLNLDFAAGTAWGSQQSGSVMAPQENVAWGPMLVEYVEQTNPGAPDDPNPPPLVPRQQEFQSIYLPLVLRNH